MEVLVSIGSLLIFWEALVYKLQEFLFKHCHQRGAGTKFSLIVADLFGGGRIVLAILSHFFAEKTSMSDSVLKSETCSR